jgi:lipopolysaccharide export system protein LptA
LLQNLSPCTLRPTGLGQNFLKFHARYIYLYIDTLVSIDAQTSTLTDKGNFVKCSKFVKIKRDSFSLRAFKLHSQRDQEKATYMYQNEIETNHAHGNSHMVASHLTSGHPQQSTTIYNTL